jgi:hypothetical protein
MLRMYCICTAYVLCLQVLPPGGQLVSIEKDLSWWLVAKRFMWQASQGQKNQQRDTPLGSKVRWLYDCTTSCSAAQSHIATYHQ